MTQNHIWAIGDIHGEIDLLEKILDRINEMTPNADLVFLGDYIGRGEHSIEVLLRLAEIRSDETVTARFLFGNWEMMFQRNILSPDAFRQETAVNKAGEQVYNDICEITRRFYELPEEKQYAIQSLFDNMAAAIITGNFIFCHAPIPAKVPVHRLNVANFVQNNVNLEEKEQYRHISGKTVVCGHSRHKRVTIYNDNLVILDTGAGLHGSLSALYLNSLFTQTPIVVSANRYRTFVARVDTYSAPPLLRDIEENIALSLSPSM